MSNTIPPLTGISEKRAKVIVPPCFQSSFLFCLAYAHINTRGTFPDLNISSHTSNFSLTTCPGMPCHSPYLPSAVLEQSSIRDKIALSSLCAMGSDSSHTSVAVVERSAKRVAVELRALNQVPFSKCGSKFRHRNSTPC